MHFDLADFRLVSNIAEESNLTRGAARSFLSVPAASQRIKNLEFTLGIKVFQRSSQGVALTEAGRAYLDHGRRILAQIELLTSELQAFGSGLKGQLKIQANTTAITEFMPPVLGAFLRDHPEVQIDMREKLSDEAVRAVRDGAADLAIISGTVPTDGTEVRRFAQSRLVAVAPLGHALASKEKARFQDLLQHEFVALLDGSATQEFLRQHALALHENLSVRVQAAGFDAVFRLVEAGIGIGVMPEIVVERMNSRATVHVCELDEPWATREYQLCAKAFESLPSFAQDLVRQIIAAYDSGPTAAPD
jgi:DNA-binding transcriptional LysR family regulator